VADGTYGNGSVDDKSLGDIVAQVSENASILVREEIELAKAEIEQKVRRLAMGAAVGAAAGFFVFLALIFAFHALAWGLSDLFNNPYGWVGYLITTGLLLLFAGVAGFLAMRAFKAGAPPTPDLAIEEAKRIRETLEHPEAEAEVAATTPKP
jgi:Putative Actinobacterial Holin-X, holin superfamily III